MNTSSAQIRKWIHEQNVPKLRELVVNGQGSRLMKETSSSSSVRKFLSSVPTMMESIREVHRAVVEGRLELLEPFQKQTDILVSKDDNQLTPLHKAVGHGHVAVVKFLIQKAPMSLSQTDSELRIPLHMCGAIPGSQENKLAMYDIVKTGSDEHHEDKKGHPAVYYLTHPNELKVDLKNIPHAPRTSSNNLSGIRNIAKTATRPQKSATPSESGSEGTAPTERGTVQTFNLKSNFLGPNDISDEEIQQWIKNGTIDKLQQLVLHGYAYRLLKWKPSTIKNAEMKQFWNNLSSYTNLKAEVLSSAESGDVERVAFLCDSCPEFPLAASRNASGATPLHQAAIQGHADVVAYLLKKLPQAIAFTDLDKRTPLHYAALGKDRETARVIFNILLKHGADRNLKDAKGNTAEVYLQVSSPESGETSRRGTAKKQPSSKPSRQQTPVNSAAVRSRTAPTMTPSPHPDKFLGKQKSAGDLIQFRTAEGSYLAEVLGDVLKQGLAQVAVHRPEDPISFLADYLQEYSGSSELRDTEESLHQIENSQFTIASVTYERDAKGQTELHRLARQSKHPDEVNPQLKELLLINNPVYIAVRDARYQTPRDTAVQSKCYGNAVAIDEVVIALAKSGKAEKLEELLLEGYDHILDAEDSSSNNVLFVAEDKGQRNAVKFLRSIMGFEEKREWLHKAIRVGSLGHVRDILSDTKLAVAKNTKGRCSLHIAILVEEADIAEFIATKFPITVAVPDNLGRTALHYAMGMYQADLIVRSLLKAGASRDAKDLMGRTPSYYFANKQEIEALQDDELKKKP